jgi:hypothetical protein
LLVVLEVECLFEYRLQGMGERAVSYVMQEGCYSDYPAFGIR